MTILRLAAATVDIPPLPPFPADSEPDIAAEPDAATLAALAMLGGDVAPAAEADALADALSDLDQLADYVAGEDAREQARAAEAAETPARRYVASWPILRRAIARRGGIDTLGDYDREDIPGGLYRRRGRGKAYDLLGETLADATGESRWFEMSADDVLAELRRAWSEWRGAEPSTPRRRRPTAPVAAPVAASGLPTLPAPVAPVLVAAAPAPAPVAAVPEPEPEPEPAYRYEPVREWPPAPILPARVRRPLPTWARALADFAVGAGLSAAILTAAAWLVALAALMAGALTLTPLILAVGLAAGLAPGAVAAGILAALPPPVAGPSPALVEECAA